MSKINNPFQREDWIEEMIKQAPEFKQFQKSSFANFKAIKRLDDKKFEVENRSSFLDIFQVFTTHAVTASLTAMLCLGGVATFAAEKTLPVEYKPSTIVNKINPFQENLKGNKKWYWEAESSLVVSSSSISSVINSSSIVLSSSLALSSVLSSSSSVISSSSVLNSSSRVLESSSTSSAVTASSTKPILSSSSKTVSVSSIKKEDSFESVKPTVDDSRIENKKLKLGETSKDKNVFSMKDGEGNIYSFSNIKGISTDLFDVKNPDQEYVFTGTQSETMIDRVKYPAIKWRIFNIKESTKFEIAK